MTWNFKDLPEPEPYIDLKNLFKIFELYYWMVTANFIYEGVVNDNLEVGIIQNLYSAETYPNNRWFFLTKEDIQLAIKYKNEMFAWIKRERERKR